MTELALPETETTVHLVARNPGEMASAKVSLEGWLKAKIKQCCDEAAELFDSAEHARVHKWKHEPFLRHANLAKRRGEFYDRALKAVQAGYTLVPNFPTDVFAVRVKRETPRRASSTSTYGLDSAKRNASNIKPESLTAGDGRYVSPMPMGLTGDYTEKDKAGKYVKHYFFNTTDFTDVAFPMEAARLEVMDATSEAMSLKVFDQIGICPQSRQADPLIIGSILGPKIGWTQKEISFLIAWHLDLRTL